MELRGLGCLEDCRSTPIYRGRVHTIKTHQSMNEAPLISLLLATISVLAIFTLVQYNQLNPNTATEHHFARSAITTDLSTPVPGGATSLINPHANHTNLTTFLLSES